MIKNIVQKIMNFKLKKENVYNKKIPKHGILYTENKPVGSRNLVEKITRQERGMPFEWPNMVALNKAIIRFIDDAKKIVNIGAGTGTFEWYASENPDITFIASEFDLECVDWCKKNRSRDNIVYTSFAMDELIQEYGKFDLAVSVDVIEHVQDYGGFLAGFRKLADRAIITTPNKDSSFNAAMSSSPGYYQHVREWDAGELYWILKMFYTHVDLYGMPDVNSPEVEQIGLLSAMTPLIAVCYETKK